MFFFSPQNTLFLNFPSVYLDAIASVGLHMSVGVPFDFDDGISN